MQAAGFEYVAASDINANPRDIPGADDVVWRLPPTLAGSKDDEARAAAMRAIGESNRMTSSSSNPRFERVDLGAVGNRPFAGTQS